ncbi:PadR family transcriptional regulator [Streptomyces uncialis]|uniref:PadR family transcriptional regulator n=1 Tax=Streptomyces uncialis TaxID=1048205 RepID=UPI00386CF654|nr:PadR family transcriptional regulator [Streptomyces uncialis]
MSIRHGLLALLDRGPRYGSRLRSEFEARTGTTWPLNVGQVYTTLGRLERDGLVVQSGTDDAGRTLYALTDEGRAELADWFGRPVDRVSPARDELAIKLAMALETSVVDVGAVIDAQRRHVARALRDHNERWFAVLASRPTRPDEVARLLLLEQQVFRAEAEARWLDHCESRLRGTAGRGGPAGRGVDHE